MRDIIFIVLCACIVGPAYSDKATITICVQDSQTHTAPVGVEHGSVVLSFNNKDGLLGCRDSYVSGHPDTNGLITISGSTETGFVGFMFDRAGYWGCWDYYQFSNKVSGVWHPVNPMIVLKVQRKENGVRLFVNRIRQMEEDFLRKHGGKVSYDMLLADWLPPIGTGVVADIECELRPQQRINTNTIRQELVYSFPGDGNGVQPVTSYLGDALKIREAPQDNYFPMYVTWRVEEGGVVRSKNKEEPNLCFRIRTKKDKNGCVISAYYGKVYHGMSYYRLLRNDDCMISSPCILYYINPTPNERFLQHEGRSLCPTYKREVLHP